MGKNRYVNKLLSIFNLTICEALSFSEGISTRVMFLYDEKENIKEFKVLSRTIPEDKVSKITSWLEENIDIYDIAYGLDSNEMDADRLSKAIKT